MGNPDLENMGGFEWVDLLLKHPEFADKCDWSKIDGNGWAELLAKKTEFADKCDWGKLEGGDWSSLLRIQPQFADRCDWAKLKEFNWAALLIEQPQFADKCDAWNRMRGNSIAPLLFWQPQFADKFDMSRFGGRLWSRILRRHPHLSDRCDFSTLEGVSWGLLLAEQPQFADKCDWAKLSALNWEYLLYRQPQFADKCPWDGYPLRAVAKILERRPAVAAAARAARGMSGHILSVEFKGTSHAVELGRRPLEPDEDADAAGLVAWASTEGETWAMEECGIAFEPFASLASGDTHLVVRLDGEKILSRELVLSHLDGVSFRNCGALFDEKSPGRWLYACRSREYAHWSSWVMEVPADFRFEPSRLVVPCFGARTVKNGEERFFVRPADIRYGDMAPDEEAFAFSFDEDESDDRMKIWEVEGTH